MRLFVALIISCLLHAALVLVPYLGASTSAPPLVLHGTRELEPARVLSVTLAPEESPAATGDGFAAGASVADASARPMADQEPRPALRLALGIALLPLPAPAYYTSDQLTKRARPDSAPKLDAPELGPVFASGTVILKLWIDELGDVVSVDVEKTDLPQAYSKTAVAAFRNLRFVPGEIDGRHVGVMMRIEVSYGAGSSPAP